MKELTGKCHICGKVSKLTFEHIPPKKADNSLKVQVINGMDTIINNNKLPWDYSGYKYKEIQRGMGMFTLCSTCNNLTGKWYVNEYIKFSNTIKYFLHEAVKKGGKYINVDIERVKILNIIKEILAMFASTVSAGCFDKNTQLRRLILDKEYNKIDLSKYRIGAYLIKEPKRAFSGINALGVKGQGIRVVAMMDVYPLGFTLDFNPNINGIETDLTDLINQTEYNKEYDLSMSLPILERNTLFPTDYRTKEEIIQCIEYNKDKFHE